MWISLTGLGEVFESFGFLLVLLLNWILGKKIMQIFLSHVFMTDLTIFNTAPNSALFKGMWISFRELFQLFPDFE